MFGFRNLIVRAREANRQKNYDEAAALYERALAIWPFAAAIHIQCGHMHKEAGDFEQAAAHYQRAKKIRPYDPDLALQLGHFYKVTGHRRAAELAYEEALRLRLGWIEPAKELEAFELQKRDHYDQRLDLVIGRLGASLDQSHHKLDEPCTLPAQKYANALTTTQKMFVSWNAERLSISEEASLSRYLHSLGAFASGHGGPEYRTYNDTSYRLFGALVDDSPREVYDAYRLHAYMHFLRMLSYPEPSIGNGDPVAERLIRLGRIDILDFGCGLAQKARALAYWAVARGIGVTLHLADIPTIRKDFLLWMLERQKIPMMFYDCTRAEPIPPLPSCDVCIATEFFEHVHDPIRYLLTFDAAMRSNGLLVTNVAEHNPEFMHVTPHLSEVRSRIAALRYYELVPFQLYQKRP